MSFNLFSRLQGLNRSVRTAQTNLSRLRSNHRSLQTSLPSAGIGRLSTTKSLASFSRKQAQINDKLSALDKFLQTMTFESDDLINKATGYRNKRLENKKALLNKQRAYKKNSHARPDTQKSTHKSPEKTSTGLRSFKDFEAQWKASGRQNTGTSTQTGTTAKQTSQHTGVTKFSDFEKRWNAEHGPQNVSVTKDADLLDALDDTDTGYLEDAHSKMLDQKYGVEKLNETDLLADLDELDDDLDNISDDSYLTNAHTPKYSV